MKSEKEIIKGLIGTIKGFTESTEQGDKDNELDYSEWSNSKILFMRKYGHLK